MITGKAQFWSLSESQLSRRKALGLDHPTLNSFITKHEFVSLGSSCGVVEALKTLGLRKFAYPFDWTRAPVDGILHCFKTDFVDFLSYTCKEIRKQGLAYTGSRWGGAIWFHDIQSRDTQAMFTRRIKRFAGAGEVKPSNSRVFVWAANAARELESTLRLRESLEQILPEAEILLLVLVNSQSLEGPLFVNSIGWGVIFYRIDELIFKERNHEAVLAKERHAYEAAMAFAINAWSTERKLGNVAEVQSLAELVATCDQFSGGDPACDLFNPRRIKGYPILIDFSRPGTERQREDMLAKRLLADSLKRSKDVVEDRDAKFEIKPKVVAKAQSTKGTKHTSKGAKQTSEGRLPPPQDKSLSKGENVGDGDVSEASDDLEAERLADLSVKEYKLANNIDTEQLTEQDLKLHRERLELELRWWSLIADANLLEAWPSTREPGLLLSFRGVPWPPPPHFDLAVRGCLVRFGAPKVSNWIVGVFQAKGFGVIVSLTGSSSSLKQLHRVPLSAVVAMHYSVSDVVWNPKLVIQRPVTEDMRFRSAEQMGSRLPEGSAGAGALPSSAVPKRVAVYSDSDSDIDSD